MKDARLSGRTTDIVEGEDRAKGMCHNLKEWVSNKNQRSIKLLLLALVARS